MSTAKKIRKYSPEEYFEIEASSEVKQEYYNGELFLMAGGTFAHNLICANLITALNIAIGDRDCKVTSSDMKLWLRGENAYLYPDVMVICGEVEFAEGRQDIITNPILVIEVLSEGTAGYDRGGKFHKYRSLEFLREYMVIEQDSFLVDVFSKSDSGEWMISGQTDPKGVIFLKSLGVSIPLSDIYKKVRFPQEKPERNSNTFHLPG